MWLDDDGEDDPIAGPVPDPSERTWRHPSEIAAELARSKEPDETAELPLALADLADGPNTLLTRDVRSMFRPLPLAGSCLMVAALGVVALFLFGPTAEDEIVAGVRPDSSDDDEPAAASSSEPTLRSTVSVTTTTTTVSTTSSSTAVALGAQASEPTPTVKPSIPQPTAAVTTAKARDTSLSTLEKSATALTELPSEEVVVASAPTASETSGVYVASSDTRLASVVVVSGDGFMLTSASALEGHTELSFWTGDHWTETELLGLDEQSDIAVLRLDASPTSLKLPVLNLATKPVKVGESVSVGETSGEGSDSYSAFSAAREADPTKTKAKTATGPVISVSENEVHALSGHQVFDLIRAEISFQRMSAGGPLLNSNGQTVGLIIGSDHPNTSAIPIETALAYGRALAETGSINTPSIGIDATTTVDNGIRIDVISPTSPAASQLEPGDVLVSVDGHSLIDADHFQHVIRQAGPGATVVLSVERARKVVDIELTLTPDQ